MNDGTIMQNKKVQKEWDNESNWNEKEFYTLFVIENQMFFYVRLILQMLFINEIEIFNFQLEF